MAGRLGVIPGGRRRPRRPGRCPVLVPLGGLAELAVPGRLRRGADYGLEGAIWECPDVFALGDTVVVVVSVNDGQPLYAMWTTGEVTGHKFAPRAIGRCDSGHRYYAPQSLTLTDGQRVAIGWLRENLDELDAADRSRVGVMSLWTDDCAAAVARTAHRRGNAQVNTSAQRGRAYDAPLTLESLLALRA